MNYPAKLNIGSGKDFREDCVNLDFDESWAPDIVFDLNEPFPQNSVFSTERFGEIKIACNAFDMIIANDVLEHIRNLETAMKSCLDLLKIGGHLEFLVPYDLSYGAWQDPSHLRGFNEKSFLYYTDWFWYLGWTEARFTVEKLEYIFSDYGKEQHRTGKPVDDITRMPRAVDYLKGALKKIPLSDNDREQIEMYRKR